MKHLIVYAFTGGFGNTDCRFNHNPPTMKDIRSAELQIQKQNNYKEKPIIMNWIEVGED